MLALAAATIRSKDTPSSRAAGARRTPYQGLRRPKHQQHRPVLETRTSSMTPGRRAHPPPIITGRSSCCSPDRVPSLGCTTGRRLPARTKIPFPVSGRALVVSIRQRGAAGVPGDDAAVLLLGIQDGDALRQHYQVPELWLSKVIFRSRFYSRNRMDEKRLYGGIVSCLQSCAQPHLICTSVVWCWTSQPPPSGAGAKIRHHPEPLELGAPPYQRL